MTSPDREAFSTIVNMGVFGTGVARLRPFHGCAVVPRLTLLLLLPVLAVRYASAENLHQLVQDAAYNEAQAHMNSTKWAYMVKKRVGNQMLTEEQVDTKGGPVYRLVAINGKTLNAGQRQSEANRVNSLLRSPRLQEKVKNHYERDERQLADLLKVLPRVFLFQYEGMKGENETIAFRPNPHVHMSGYEGRVMQALKGKLVINVREKRIASFSGGLFKQVDFGFGLLGKINQGGTFEVDRKEVSPGVWKTNLIHIDISGRFSFFATISKQEYEIRWNFRKVPDDITVPQAYKLLDRTF